MAKINLKSLNKGHIRKLTALRKSLGQKIADKAFLEWQSKQLSTASADDKNAKMIEVAVAGLIKSKGLVIPQRGYKITRGRGKVKVSSMPVPTKANKPKPAATVSKKPARKKTAAKKKSGARARK